MSDAHKDWEIYERLVAELLVRELSPEFCVTANAQVTGHISRQRRQIDVLFDVRHDTDNSRRIIVDAKRQRRKVDITHVEALRALMEDVGATHGDLVCPHGQRKPLRSVLRKQSASACYPSNALRTSIRHAGAQCQREGCSRGRVFWDGFTEVNTAVHLIYGAGLGNGKLLPFILRGQVRPLQTFSRSMPHLRRTFFAER